MYQWVYRDTIESGIMILLEDVPAHFAAGWVDTPDKYGGTVALDNMDSGELRAYCLEKYEVALHHKMVEKNIRKKITELGG